jgi:hypothetical protein
MINIYILIILFTFIFTWAFARDTHTDIISYARTVEKRFLLVFFQHDVRTFHRRKGKLKEAEHRPRGNRGVVGEPRCSAAGCI